MAAKRREHNNRSGKAEPRAKPKVRSPVPPPGRVIGPTSYDRNAEKGAERRAVEEFSKSKQECKKNI